MKIIRLEKTDDDKIVVVSEFDAEEFNNLVAGLVSNVTGVYFQHFQHFKEIVVSLSRYVDFMK